MKNDESRGKNMNKLEQFRYNVLEKLRQAFDTLDMAAILRDPLEDIPTHMLNVLHTELGHSEEEVMGEYYFLPIDDENAKFHLFSSMLTMNMMKWDALLICLISSFRSGPSYSVSLRKLWLISIPHSYRRVSQRKKLSI
jgi:hypothetical protein